MKSCALTIKHPVGLHARPAALFVQTAQKHTSRVQVTCNDKTVNAKSMLGVLSLGATRNATIIIQAAGDDEESAIHELESLVNANFGE